MTPQKDSSPQPMGPVGVDGDDDVIVPDYFSEDEKTEELGFCTVLCALP